MNYIEFTGLKAFTSEFKLRANPTCVRLTSITFPVIWSSVLISVTREWRYRGLIYKFFLINNRELKCSFVWCRKYHKSWSNGAAELHISVDLLCDKTAAELHNSVNLLCGITAAELTRFDACTSSRRHFPKTVTNHAEKYEGLIESKIWQQTPERWTLWTIQQSQIDVRFTYIQQTF